MYNTDVVWIYAMCQCKCHCCLLELAQVTMRLCSWVKIWPSTGLWCQQATCEGLDHWARLANLHPTIYSTDKKDRHSGSLHSCWDADIAPNIYAFFLFLFFFSFWLNGLAHVVPKSRMLLLVSVASGGLHINYCIRQAKPNQNTAWWSVYTSPPP